MHEIQNDKQKCALVVGVELPGDDPRAVTSSMAELERLLQTLGYVTVVASPQRRKKLSPSTLVGKGKVSELALFTGGPGIEDVDAEEHDHLDPRFTLGAAAPRAELVAFDHELSPGQLRNLELALGCQVMDRASVILEIFSRHARTREAKIQVEIARLRYLAPRLRETGPSDRQQGGIGQKGLGETAYELERRRVRQRISELELELSAIHREQRARRERRSQTQRIALVGYTNAGKSSLMQVLTGSEVLVANKLFATLDTTVRAIAPETHPRILVADTVGFIHRLPHDLVASFRTTLDEALDADLLIHLVDASDPEYLTQIKVTEEVLKDIGADKIPRIMAFNKIDLLQKGARNRLPLRFPGALGLSTLEPETCLALKERVIAFFEEQMEDVELEIPYARSSLIADLRENGRVLEEEFLEAGVRLKVRAYPALIQRTKTKLLQKSG